MQNALKNAYYLRNVPKSMSEVPPQHPVTSYGKLTKKNSILFIAVTYPALLLVPSKVADESLKRYARLHRQSRFPSVTWKHSKNQALLLRGSIYNSNISIHSSRYMSL